MPPAAELSFLPWVRQGASAAITQVDTLGQAQPAVATLAATLAVNGNALPALALRLRGPADVLGIDPGQVVRMDPAPDSHDGEPSYFPCIEFDRADFPWLFTPARAAAAGKLRPWLVLVVVRKQPGVSLSAGATSPLPSLRIEPPAQAADELPDLRDSWAWAHAQAAATDTSAASVQAALRGSPALSLSRLICPRILAADTDYLACVVPAFDVSRRSGLGLPVDDADVLGADALAPAWTWSPALADVLLPVYHRWEFRTGPGGDFATLAARLRPRAVPEALGKRPIAIGDPGFALPAGFPTDARLLGEGALRAMSVDGEPDPMPPWPQGTELAFKDALAPIVNAPGENAVHEPDAEPLLAPPLYGRWHARRDTVTRQGQDWFDELNLDPRLRSTAAFGTRVIQRDQEALVASAWAQAGSLEAANQRMRQLQLSCAVGERLQARHFAGLSADAALRVHAPLLARAATTGMPVAGRNMLQLLATTPLPLRALGPAMRRIARQRGPLTRRLGVLGLQRSKSWIASLNAGDADLPKFKVPDIVSFDAVIAHLPVPTAVRAFSAVTDAEVLARAGMPWFVVRAESAPVPIAFSFTRGPASNDSTAARDFRRAAAAHLARVQPSRSAPGVAFAAGTDLGRVAQSLAAQTRPRNTLAAFARNLIAPPSPTRPPGTGERGDTGSGAGPHAEASARARVDKLRAIVASAVDALRTIDVVPSFDQPMVEALRDLAPDLVLPGLDTVPEDSVLGLETNRRFVEAFIVGLNFEMARELVWRGFPTRQDATFFDRFWGGAPDVPPLDRWGTRRLGDPNTAEPRERFVMLMRSALLRRYPNALIYLTPAIATAGARAPSDDPALERLPVFAGTMPPDISWFGFDVPTAEVVGQSAGGTGNGYYLVIQQHPTEPRFGLHPDASAGVAGHVAASGSAPAGQPLGGHEWGRNSAHMAAIVRRLPVRLAIHASQLMAVGS
ncbi:MAG: hypothetical protein GX644_02465 [Limnobacter sp.]|nr:hypothetical protein [Limnobacter sp.]